MSKAHQASLAIAAAGVAAVVACSCPRSSAT